MITKLILTLVTFLILSYPSVAIFIASIMSTDCGKTRGFFCGILFIIVLWTVPLYFIWF